MEEGDPHRFQFDLDRGIRDQVVEAPERSPCEPLVAGVGPTSSGIYALYFAGRQAEAGREPTGSAGGTGCFRRKTEPFLVVIFPFAAFAIAADYPETMALPSMVGEFPLV